MRMPTVKTARRSPVTTESIRCVVLESGSLPLTDSDAENFDHTIVIAQMQDEPAAAFAERTLERIAGLERTGRRFISATLLAGSRHETAAQTARRRIVLSLAQHLHAAQSTHGAARLTLCASRDTAPEHRAELLDLAADVMAYPNDTPSGITSEPVGVRLRFDEGTPEPRRQSGTFHAIPDRPASTALRRLSGRR
jgi:hypothetical protein